MNTWFLYLLLLKATVMSFSGLASIPVVREDLVAKRGVITDEQLSNAIAISQASPGPIGLYVVIVGYFVTGIPGAIAGAVALASPAVLAVPISRAVRRGRVGEIQGACSAIVIVSCVLMMKTAVQLAPEAVPDIAFAFVTAGGFLLLAATRVPPLVVVLGSACVGLLF